MQFQMSASSQIGKSIFSADWRIRVDVYPDFSGSPKPHSRSLILLNILLLAAGIG